MGIIESVQQYDLNIPAGGAQAIDVAGDRVQFLSATDPFAQIEIRPNFAQGNISLRPGQGFRFSEQVTRWVVFNRSTVALSGYLLIGSGDFFDQRISGDVNVLDNSKSRTLSGDAFLAYIYLLPAAGESAHTQVWNPAGSGVRAVIRQFSASSAVAGAITLASHTSPLSTLSPQGNPKSRYLTVGRATKLESRVQSSAALIAATNNIYATQIAAGGKASEVFTSPLILDPGVGMIVRLEGAAGAAVTVNAEVEEVAI
ncbi:hypothetical protein [Cupriavidus sp. H39]|uniref:hypothetical protein n=1 Tax=Cupriavidus sp. H39 TaxID=3401635 RepID=UPI003D0243D2